MNTGQPQDKAPAGAEQDTSVGDLVARLPALAVRSDELVGELRSLVASLPARDLLLRAWIERQLALVNVESDLDMGEPEISAARLGEYLQSVIAGTPPATDQKDRLSDRDWESVKALVENLRTTQYQYAMAHALATSNPRMTADGRGDELRLMMPTLTMNSRGKNYPAHWLPYYEDMLGSTSEIFERVLGVTSDDIITGLAAFHRVRGEELAECLRSYVLLVSVSDSFEAVSSEREAQDAGSPSRAEDQLETEAIEALQHLAASAGRIESCELFDVAETASLPIDLLDMLSWAPGEDTEFFGRSAMCGWPLTPWPTFIRPFIKLEGRYYCFDEELVADRIVSALEHAALVKAPRERRNWQRIQATNTEETALRYLGALLPGSQIYRNVRYDLSGRSQETDGILVYDGHLLIVEAKGGSFPAPSPLEEFDQYVDLVRKRLEKPVFQAQRLRDALAMQGTVDLRSGDSPTAPTVVTLIGSDIRSITSIAVSREPMTEFASQIHHLHEIGLGRDIPAAWIVSLDDLRLCAAIFDNPLMFLHYLQERLRGGANAQLWSNDELDHLGLYLGHNMYDVHVADVANQYAVDSYREVDAREVIDRHFMHLSPESVPTRGLRQDMPPLFEALVDAIALSMRPGRSDLGLYLLDSGGDLRIELDEQVRMELEAQPRRGRPLFLTLNGPDREDITVVCWTPSVDRRSPAMGRGHVDCLLAMQPSRPVRLLLELVVDGRGQVADVLWEWCRFDQLSEERRMALAPAVLATRKRRVAATARQRVAERGSVNSHARRRLRRNEPCPCASGVKYKKCCLPRFGDRLDEIATGDTRSVRFSG